MGFQKTPKVFLGELDQALRYLREALDILDKHGLAHGRGIFERAIAEIEGSRT